MEALWSDIKTNCHEKIDSLYELINMYEDKEYIDTANALALYGYAHGSDKCRSFYNCEHLRHRYKFYDDNDPLVNEMMSDKYKPLILASWAIIPPDKLTEDQKSPIINLIKDMDCVKIK